MPLNAYTDTHKELVDIIQDMNRNLIDIVNYINYIKQNLNRRVEELVNQEVLNQGVNNQINNLFECFQMNDDHKITSTYMTTLPIGILTNIVITHLKQIMKIEYIQRDEYNVYNPNLFKKNHFEIMHFVFNKLHHQYVSIQRHLHHQSQQQHHQHHQHHQPDVTTQKALEDIFIKYKDFKEIHQHFLAVYSNNPEFAEHHYGISSLIDTFSEIYQDAETDEDDE